MIKLKALLIQESFNSAREFLLNPAYDNKPYAELLNDFRLDGGDVLGGGRYGVVLWHPSWKYVLKLFTQDVPYLKYVRFARQNPRPSFPIFYDKPRRIRPHWKRSRREEFIYVVLTEKLSPVSYDDYADIKFYLYYGGTEFKTAPDTDVWKQAEIKVSEIERRHPTIKNLKADYDFLMNAALEGADDMGKSNVMKRANGQFVLTDPLWEGETPYQRYDRMMKAETGDYENERPPSTQLSGGERYKKPKPTKPKKSEPIAVGDEVPF